MKIKIIIGYFLIGLSFLMSLFVLTSLFQIPAGVLDAFEREGTAYGIGFSFGYVIGYAIIGAIIYSIYRLGEKLRKSAGRAAQTGELNRDADRSAF